jgi:transcriptional regulator NrdR family protein
VDLGSTQDPVGIKRGRICAMCDRKFMLYDYYAEFACQVEEMDALIKE